MSLLASSPIPKTEEARYEDSRKLAIAGGLLLFFIVIVSLNRPKRDTSPRPQPRTAKPRPTKKKSATLKKSQQSGKIVYNGKEISNIKIVDDWAEGHRAIGRAKVRGSYTNVVIYYDQNWKLLNVR